MLIPRFSLRWLLAVMTACSVAFLVISQAVHGQHWAQALCAAGAALVLAMIFQASSFVVARIGAELVGSSRPPSSDSPFAAGPPPQIIPPDDSLVE